MAAYRIYTLDTDGCRTLKKEFTDTNDLEALRAAFEAVRRFPAQRIWLLECDPDDAQVSEQSQLPGELVRGTDCLGHAHGHSDVCDERTAATSRVARIQPGAKQWTARNGAGTASADPCK